MNNILNYDDTPLRRYLLGELPPREEEQVEERLLTDNDYIEHLEIVEEDLIDEYVRGDLPPPQLQSFEKLFLSHPERRKKIRLAKSLMECAERLNPQPSPQPNLLSRIWERLTGLIPAPVLYVVAGTAAVIAISIGVYQILPHRSPEVANANQGIELLDEAYRRQRPFEARIAGFDFAEYAVKKGGAEDKMDRLSFERANQMILDALADRSDAASQYAAAKLFLLRAANQLTRATELSEKSRDPGPAIEQAKEDLDTAIGHYEEALKLAPNNAAYHCDLGVAFMERGKLDLPDPDSGQSLKYFGQSAKQLDLAIKNNDSLLEAWFNRALLRHTQQLWSQAEESWVEYLKRDANSPWAKEAREKLDVARRKKAERKSMTKERILQDFLSAYRRGDRDEAWRVLSQNRDPVTGKLIWWQLAGEFLKYSVNGQPDQAADVFRALTLAGEMEAAKGDRFVSGIVSYYQKLPREKLPAIKDAHELANQGHSASLRSNYNEALILYSMAKDRFEMAGDKSEAIFTDYWVSYSYLAARKTTESQLALGRISSTAADGKYLWLQAQALSLLGSIQYQNTDQGQSIKYVKQALDIAFDIEDTRNIVRNFTMLGYLYHYLKEHDQALHYFQNCLKVAHSSWPGSRQMWRTNITMAPALNALGFYEVADDYLKESLSFIEEFNDPAQIYLSYSSLGDLYSTLGNQTEAIRMAKLGYETAKSLSKTEAGLEWAAYSSLKLGNLYYKFGDTKQALNYYDDCIRWYQKLQNQIMVYDAHKGRLLCYLANNDNDAAEKEIQATLSYTEKYRPNITDEKLRNSFFDSEQKFFDLAIDFEYTRRGNYSAAYNHSEFSQARSLLALLNSHFRRSASKGASGIWPLSLQQIQRQMPAEAQILQFSLLENNFIAWVITKTNFSHIKQEISIASLQEKVNKFRGLITERPLEKNREVELLDEAKSLYRILITPVEHLLDKNKLVCLVPDKALYQFPFGAIISPNTGNYLIKEHQLMVAPSATVFVQCFEIANRLSDYREETLLSVGNPSWDQTKFRLPELHEAENEVQAIARFYPSATVLTGNEAQEPAVMRGLVKANIAHLSTHYLVDKQSPMLSKLILAQGFAESADTDGLLQASEIYAKRFTRTKLVVLSACESGVEKTYNGEGMIGLSRTFIASGVPLVVASLWKVEERSTAKLMVSLHQYRREGKLSTAEALRRAQIDIITDNAKNGVVDYNWASFVVIGGYSNF